MKILNIIHWILNLAIVVGLTMAGKTLANMEQYIASSIVLFTTIYFICNVLKTSKEDYTK